MARLIPHAKLVRLPEEVGEGGDVTDFFVLLGRSREEFEGLLEAANPLPEEKFREIPEQSPVRAHRDKEIDLLKSQLAIQELVARYLPLRVSGQNFIARCPFHEDRKPSFVVFPETQSFYCFGCRQHGDVISFLMRMERLTFPEALDVLRQMQD